MPESEPDPYVIPGPLARSVNVGLVNDAAVTTVECCRIDRDGVWFADTLPPAEEQAVRDWLATRDDQQLARRQALRAIDSKDLLNGFDILRAYTLGDPLPQPVYPPPEPEPAPG